ncbi:MAG: glutamate racemase [Thermomicrobiales bacterium]
MSSTPSPKLVLPICRDARYDDGMTNQVSPASPIGIFDSGLGGLSVLREVRDLLPAEDLIYFADSAYCPYGTRTPKEILNRGLAITGELTRRDAKLIIVACNTASSVAIDELRAACTVSIVGLEPAVKPAVRRSRTGRVAVLATPRTVAGKRLADLVARHSNGADVRLVPAPGWVELVESGRTSGPEAERAVVPLVEPLPRAGVDTIVLGCTHYPFLRPIIERVTGPEVAIIDSGEAIARRARDVLAAASLLRTNETPGSLAFFTTGPAKPVGNLSARLLGVPVTANTLAV